MSRRGAVAGVVLIAWGVGLAVFLRREIRNAPAQGLAEAAHPPHVHRVVTHRPGSHTWIARINLSMDATLSTMIRYPVTELFFKRKPA